MAGRSIIPGDRLAEKALLPLAFIGLLLLLLSSAWAQPLPTDTPRVLIINSYTQSLTWTRQEVSGILRALRQRYPDIEPSIEDMDWKSFPTRQNLEALRALFHYRYAHKRLDLIITTDNAALDFALSLRKDLFPNVPIVFCGVNYSNGALPLLPPNVTGVLEAIDPEATLRLAFRLQPNARLAMLVVDNSETGQQIRRQIETVLPHFRNRAKFIFVNDWSIDQITRFLRDMPNNSFIYMTSYTQDSRGAVFSIDQGFRIIQRDSHVPIYHAWDFALGHGIVGGSLISGEDQGYAAGRIAVRVLQGANIRSIPIMPKTSSISVVDYRALRRFNINPRLVPPNVTVVNKPFSLYQTYRRLIWTVVLVILGLVAIIALLLLNINTRKRAEKEILESEERYRRLFENNPELISIYRDGKYVAVNPAVEKILGYTPEEIIGSSPGAISPEYQPDGTPSREFITRSYEEACRHGSRFMTYVMRHKNGARVDLELSMATLSMHGLKHLLIIGRDVTERNRAEERRRDLERSMEERMHLFYRQTLRSVTGGKLDMSDPEEIERILATSFISIEVQDYAGVSAARHAVQAFCMDRGITGERLEMFMLAVGEAITNAVKHGKRGRTYAGTQDDSVWVGVSDQGPGIDALVLPQATLQRGFSTKPSLGLGYSIMLDVADQVLLQTGPAGTTVILFLKIHEAKPEYSLDNIPDVWQSIPALY